MFRGDRGGGCWMLGVCAVALGAGILIAAIFPVGALMFLVASLLIAVLLNSKIRGIVVYRTAFFFPYVASLVAVGAVWNMPKALRGILRKLFGIKA